MTKMFATLLMLSAITPALCGQVPPEVVSVESGGYWESDGRSGSYRVVVTNHGFEHVTSRVVVEWVADPESPREGPVIVAAVEPPLPFGNGVASLSATLDPVGPGHVRITLSGAIAVDPTQSVGAVIAATAPGEVAVEGS